MKFITLGEKQKLYNFAIKRNRNNDGYDKSKKKWVLYEKGKSDRQVGKVRCKENEKKLKMRKDKLKKICEKMLKKNLIKLDIEVDLLVYRSQIR